MTQEELQAEKEQEENSATDQGASLKLSSAPGAVSQSYSNTMDALKGAEYSLPTFSSDYDKEISELYGKIVNRRSFKYEPSGDPLYGVYKEQYAAAGGLAMRDSMGQAAALTGGYGSSYGQSVGQQQYNNYMQKLNEVLPELYNSAFRQYESEGQQMQDKLDAAYGMEEKAYGRYRDKVEDTKYQQSMKTQSEQTDYDRTASAFSVLMELISATGYQPSEAELQNAGMSDTQAEALRNEYLRVNRLLPSTKPPASASNNSYSYLGGTKKETTKIDNNSGTPSTTKKPR